PHARCDSRVSRCKNSARFLIRFAQRLRGRRHESGSDSGIKLKPKPQVTVAIPTWNGAQRIGCTLETLASQDGDANCFEVVIVDNDSPEAGRVADNHPGVIALRQRGIECRVVSESRRGLVYARIRGVLEAHSELVCFLDDDTEPSPTYIAEGISVFA